MLDRGAIEAKIQAAFDAGIEIHDAVVALDGLDDDCDLELEEDGGSLYPEDTGLAVNELLRLYSECLCCGDVHSCESIQIA